MQQNQQHNVERVSLLYYIACSSPPYATFVFVCLPLCPSVRQSIYSAIQTFVGLAVSRITTCLNMASRPQFSVRCPSSRGRSRNSLYLTAAVLSAYLWGDPVCHCVVLLLFFAFDVTTAIAVAAADGPLRRCLDSYACCSYYRCCLFFIASSVLRLLVVGAALPQLICADTVKIVFAIAPLFL